MQVLIADDDMISRMALVDVLSAMDSVKISQADSGDKAWQMLLDGFQPDLCCFDVRMPGISGLELFRRLPAQAALDIDLAEPAISEMLTMLAGQTGVRNVDSSEAGKHLHIALTTHEFALPLMNYLSQQGCVPLHFSTAQTKLEDVFLTLTGRSLRD